MTTRPSVNTMRAVLYYGPQDIRLMETPIPQPRAGELVMKVEAALTCGTDFKAFRQGHRVLLGQNLPVPFGHEMAGTVARIGAGVSAFLEGQRVVAVNSAPCDTCFHCRRGEPELCDHLDLLNGAYAEYVRIPPAIVKHNVHSIPDSLSYSEAALAEPLACALHAVDKLAIKPGETVVLIGAGNMGRLLICGLKQAHAQIIVLGRNHEHLKLAKKAGADEVISLLDKPDAAKAVLQQTEDGRGADAVIEAVGKPETWQLAQAMVRKGGRICLFGGCAAGTHAEMDTHRIHYHEITLFGVFHHRPQYVREAVRLLSEGKIPTRLLINQEISLEQVIPFFHAHATANPPKAAIKP